MCVPDKYVGSEIEELRIIVNRLESLITSILYWGKLELAIHYKGFFRAQVSI